MFWSKDFVSFFLVLLDSSAFLIYNILTFDQKKKKSQAMHLGICYWPMSSSLLHGQAPELLACRCLFGWGTHGAAGFWKC
jgi:hypothetical protein